MKSLSAEGINPLAPGYAWLLSAPSAKRPNRAHWISLAGLLAGCLLVAAPLFYRSLFGMIIGDHDVHVRFIQRGVAEGVWPAHFLFQALVYALSGFRSDFTSLAWASLGLLTACVVAKAWITYVLLVRQCPRLQTTTFEDTYRLPHVVLLALVAATLMVASPIARSAHHIYLGQISPNIWHNPTTIVCWPLVILLFFAADAFLRSGRPRELLAVASLAALGALAKPNYFLAFAPVYTLLALRRFGFSRLWLLSQVALVPTVLLLCWQFAASFDGPHAMRPGRHIAWMPLAAWRIHSHSIVRSLWLSLAFPISYLVVFRRTIQNRHMLLFAWGVMLSALVWTACFAEVGADGTVDGDFNFSWGSALSIFVLFLATAIDLLDNPLAMTPLDRNPRGLIAGLPWWLLGAHGASGIVWIIRQIAGRGYC